MDYQSLQKQMILVAQSMNASQLNQGTSGNLSCRIEGGMLITPSSIPYEKMSPEDLVNLDLSGNPLPGKESLENQNFNNPSSEWRLHADILKNRPEINAVLHCHSIHATAIACHARSIPSFHYMTAVAGGDEIRCAKYATFGTSELSQNAVQALKGRYACLLAQHGQVTIASNLNQALHLALEIETLAHMYLQACQLGEPQNLSAEEMKLVLEKFKTIKYGVST